MCSHWTGQFAAAPRLDVFSGLFACTLRRDSLRAFEERRAEIPRRQHAHALQHAQVRARAEHAVLRGRRTQRTFAQRQREFAAPCGIRDRNGSRSVQRNRLYALRTEHRTRTPAAGLTPVVVDRGKAHETFAGRADRGYAKAIAQRRAQARRRFGGTRAEQRLGIEKADALIVDDQRDPRVARPPQHERRKAQTTERSRPVAR